MSSRYELAEGRLAPGVVHAARQEISGYLEEWIDVYCTLPSSVYGKVKDFQAYLHRATEYSFSLLEIRNWVRAQSLRIEGRPRLMVEVDPLYRWINLQSVDMGKDEFLVRVTLAILLAHTSMKMSGSIRRYNR